MTGAGVAPQGPTDLATRFLASLNARDYRVAAGLYAEDAVYRSPALVGTEHDGQIVGRDQIIEYFADALAGDDGFRLRLLDSFDGLDVVVVVSTLDGRAFVDVLRTDAAGSIAEHIEVTPKRSPLVF